MGLDSGLTAEGAQLAICKGTYGGKEWSATERKEACERYESMTDGRAESGSKPFDYLPTIAMASALLLVVLFIYVTYRRKTKRKR